MYGTQDTSGTEKVIYWRGENEKGIRRPILRRFSCQYVKTSINYERHRFYDIYYIILSIMGSCLILMYL